MTFRFKSKRVSRYCLLKSALTSWTYHISLMIFILFLCFQFEIYFILLRKFFDDLSELSLLFSLHPWLFSHCVQKRDFLLSEFSFLHGIASLQKPSVIMRSYILSSTMNLKLSFKWAELIWCILSLFLNAWFFDVPQYNGILNFCIFGRLVITKVVIYFKYYETKVFLFSALVQKYS